MKYIIDTEILEREGIGLDEALYLLSVYKEKPINFNTIQKAKVENKILKFENSRDPVKITHKGQSYIESILAKSKIHVSSDNLELLREELRAFFKENLMECMIQKHEHGFYAFTTVQILESITNHYTTCSLSGYLNAKLPFECAVGYGIGNTLADALQNSYHAVREARFAGHSFIKNDFGELIGPLDSENRMVIEQTSNKDTILIARKCKLSTITIQKLISYQKLTGTNKVTCQELSSRFGVTVRNANRILQNLLKGGYANVAYTRTQNSKGRPTKVYELNFQ